jgi:hypothetical protein
VLVDQAHKLAGFDVPPCLQFAVDQIAVDLDLEPASVAGDESQPLDARLERLKNLFRCAHGTGEVVSNRTVSDGNVKHGYLPFDSGVLCEEV